MPTLLLVIFLCLILLAQTEQGATGPFLLSSTLSNCSLSQDSCFQQHTGKGCNNCCLQDCVCGYMNFCCQDLWRPSCVSVLEDLCLDPCNASKPNVSSPLQTGDIVAIVAIGLLAITLSCVIVGLAIIYKKYYRKGDKEVNPEEKEAFNPTKPPSANSVMVHYAAPKENDPDALFRELEQKWHKPLAELPVHVDLPRLVQGIQVTYNGSHVWPSEPIDSGMKREDLILDFLTTLTKLLEGTEQAVLISESFGNYFTEENLDISKRLLKFLPEVLGENSVAKVLKSCNQSIVASAVLRLKFAIANEFPYIDVNRQWKIRIEINRNSIQVVHQKWEKSLDLHSFQFQWELSIRFSRDMETLEYANIVITELNFGSSDIAARRQAIRRVMEPFIQED